MNPLIPIMVILPICCALLLNLFHNKDKTVKILAIVVGIVLPIIPLVANYGVHYFGGYPPLIEDPTLSQGLPSFITTSALNLFHPAITYSFASAQKIFIFILGLVAFFAIFTSLSETKRPSGVYTFLMFMGTAAITAVLLSDDIFNLYVFFEIAALAQVGIIICSGVDRNYETALKYMLLGSIAAPMLLLGIAILLGLTGNVNITDIVFSLKNGLVDPKNPLFLMACGLILFGWLYGSGLPPFHTIKSAVYSKALPHGAALLQAFSVFTFVALGIIVIRIFGYLPLTQWAIIFFSLLAMILGITMALMQTDFKRIIGYLAVGELGYIGLGLGLGTAFGISAGLFQAVNEAIVTAFIFIGFGTILYKTGISDTNKLGGLLADNPWVAGLVLMAGFAMAGVPPLNVFQSKLQLIQGSISAGLPELGIIMVLLSIITFMTFMKAFYTIYLRPRPKDLEIINEKIPRATIISMVAFLVICLVLGLFPQLVTDSLTQIAQGLV